MGTGKIAIFVQDGKLKSQMELSKDITNGELCQLIANLNLLLIKLTSDYSKRVKFEDGKESMDKR